ncbi:hypothetical protein Ddye_007461 [Dipteronia dyeriana]|uniref:MLO-like protein n=1 Tax=Dipteronia dyeriana TaxID=168575 RepID=A0AAE0CS57_9ROSI|nr:hypothetical protein Ddye_007461 [Dipteronia dyeriana]
MAIGRGGEGARELDHTPTWAVSTVCFTIVVISIILEKVIHAFGMWFKKRRKEALFQALEKIKSELMVLGFISLILTFGQNYIAKICIPLEVADTMLPCLKEETNKILKHDLFEDRVDNFHGLLSDERRILAGDNTGSGCQEGYLPLISLNGLHQLHIFIFFLAVFHVMYSAITMLLGKLKIRGWKQWELEIVNDNEMINDPRRFRLTHQTSFVKNHTSYWMRNPFSFYVICFFRQFIRSVRKADYLTMRHGFITVHLAPGSRFNFQKYIKRSLEDDFKVVVGISPILWASVVLFLLLNVHGWAIMYVITLTPLIVILSVGTKLQGIISQMAMEITERHTVIQGIPLVQVSDSYFWFCWPELILHLIHFVLFQNAFEITYFLWIWYEYGLRSCFHDDFVLSITRVILGVGVQFMCSYITLPLYALVTQMGSTMKRSIFDDQTSKAIRQWHKKAMLRRSQRSQGSASTKSLGGVANSPDIEVVTTSNKTANIVASVDNEDQRNGAPSGQQ